MKLESIVSWLDGALSPSRFDDVANNGLQISRDGDELDAVAFGVDASAAFIENAADAGAGLCVVHHGISWGGGVKRLQGSVFRTVKTAIGRNVALYASHLPLDANEKYGNNFEIARFLGLDNVVRAFTYHGNTIGLTGFATRGFSGMLGKARLDIAPGAKVGVCSGGAGEFAEDALAAGCSVYITGEASWGDIVAARNVGMEMVLCGHYETETFGVKALARGLARSTGVKTFFIDRPEG